MNEEKTKLAAISEKIRVIEDALRCRYSVQPEAQSFLFQ